MPRSLLLDTDIGDDIDDALALALLLHAPELELCGITTVFRDAERRAQLTRYLLQAFECADVPVAAGASRPLLQPWSVLHGGAQVGKQFAVLPGEIGELATVPDTPHAVDFVCEVVKQYESEAHDGEERPLLTYLCIGPLTNVALLLASTLR